MPLSTVIPPSLPSVVREYVWPHAFGGSRPETQNPGVVFSRAGSLRPGGMQGGPAITGGEESNSFALGIANQTTPLYRAHRGRLCAGLLSSAAGLSTGACMVPPGWTPVWEGPGNASGTRVNAESVVGIFDFHASFVFTAPPLPGWPNDTSGFVFLPHSNQTWGIQTAVPGAGAVNAGGFGVFVNVVGGAPALEWVSWLAGGAILERVPLPTPDLLAWNRFRFELVTGSAGAAPTVALTVNATDVLDRTFGTAELRTPNGYSVGALQLAPALVPGALVHGPDSDTMFLTAYFRWGPYTAAGVEVQAP